MVHVLTVSMDLPVAVAQDTPGISVIKVLKYSFTGILTYYSFHIR
jgi:hypothetical protein